MKWKPEGYTSVSSYLVTRRAQEVVDFRVGVLDATPLRRYENDDGTIAHAELRIDDSGRSGRSRVGRGPVTSVSPAAAIFTYSERTGVHRGEQQGPTPEPR